MGYQFRGTSSGGHAQARPASQRFHSTWATHGEPLLVCNFPVGADLISISNAGVQNYSPTGMMPIHPFEGIP